MARLLARLSDPDQSGVWISKVDPTSAMEAARALDARRENIDDLPLFGLIMSVKDCIDVAGISTTCACPEFAYMPERSSPVVDRALAAGALFIGKTNLDQFATGLVGVRSPYGTARNPHNPDYIPGGSSSGAAVSVATGTSSFALGTDTGGSGRVPASYCGVTGLKPTPGALSRNGMTNACRSFDTISIYTDGPSDAFDVFSALAAYDPEDCFSLAEAGVDSGATLRSTNDLRLAVPKRSQRKFFGNAETEALFETGLQATKVIFDSVEETDFSLFTDLNGLMFFGPFLAERYLSVGRFLEENPNAGEPVVRELILQGADKTAAEAYEAIYQIRESTRRLAAFWRDYDALLVPTVGTIVTVEEVRKDPLGPNFNNGYYTNFANPLGLAACSVPNAVTSQGVPYGVTFLGPGGSEGLLSRIGDSFARR